MNRLLVFIFSLLSLLSAGAVSPDDLEYPVRNGVQYMISDPEGYLSPQVRAKLEKQLEDIRRKYTVEVAVVLPPDLDGMEANQWCERLFTRWKIGKADKDNGLLVMISPGAREAFIMPGYGMEGVFTDIACRKMLQQVVVPYMKEGDVDDAVENVVALISDALANPEVAEELRSSQGEAASSALDPEVFWTLVQYLIAFFFLVSLILFLSDCRKARKFPTHYEKATFWRSHLAALGWLGLLSCGTGLIFFALAFIIYRSWRTRPLPCSTCGHKMKRLPEDKDNELLSDSEDFEENLKTVDYDVWECPQCGTVERFPYRSSQKVYTECPACHTVAMSLESDSVVRPATTRSAGEGVKVYSCKFCHHRLRRPYVIPRKEDPSAALAAAAVLGAATRGGHGGGSGGGFGGFGGFGGGATGGGGAGARW